MELTWLVPIQDRSDFASTQKHRRIQIHAHSYLLRLFLLGLLTSTRDKYHEIVGISNREEHGPSSFTISHACPHRRRSSIAFATGLNLPTMMCPPLISFLDDAEGDIGEKR